MATCDIRVITIDILHFRGIKSQRIIMTSIEMVMNSLEKTDRNIIFRKAGEVAQEVLPATGEELASWHPKSQASLGIPCLQKTFGTLLLTLLTFLHFPLGVAVI